MRISFRLIPAVLLLTLITGAGCGIAKLSRLSSCEFRVTTLENTRLANIAIQNIRSFKDVSLLDAGKLLAAFTSGSLPVEFTLNVEVKNPNKGPAVMGRMDWTAFVDDLEVAQGILQQRVEIPGNGGVATVPVTVRADLFQILKGKGKDTMLNFAFNLAGMGNKPTRAGIKVKPYIKVGKKSIPYPGSFKLSEKFSSK